MINIDSHYLKQKYIKIKNNYKNNKILFLLLIFNLIINY